MILKLHRLSLIVALAAFTAACAPRPASPSADAISTAVAQAAFDLLTQTASAASPTPRPPTATPLPSATPTLDATVTPTSAPKRPQTSAFAGCWYGPGPTYVLESHITKGKAVDLLGIGDQPGWYIIRNPYFHQPCWIEAANLTIFPGTDLSTLPVMTPGP